MSVLVENRKVQIIKITKFFWHETNGENYWWWCSHQQTYGISTNNSNSKSDAPTLPAEWRSWKIKNCAQICLITTLLMYPLLTLNYSSATQKTVCSASVYASYQNRNHIPAAAVILVNQDHLMHLAAVFQIQMKHLCKKAISPSSHWRWGLSEMMQLVITSCQTPRRHNSAWQLDSSFDSLKLVEFFL